MRWKFVVGDLRIHFGVSDYSFLTARIFRHEFQRIYIFTADYAADKELHSIFIVRMSIFSVLIAVSVTARPQLQIIEDDAFG